MTRLEIYINQRIAARGGILTEAPAETNRPMSTDDIGTLGDLLPPHDGELLRKYLLRAVNSKLITCAEGRWLAEINKGVMEVPF